MKNYEKIRENIVTGDLFFTRSNALFSRIIRLATQSDVSHVGVFLRLWGRLFIVEALEWSGVVMSLASERVKEVQCFWARTSRAKKSINEIENHLLTSLRKKYDMIGALLSLITDTKTAKKFCSELASEAIGIKLPYNKRGITPADMINLCETVEEISC